MIYLANYQPQDVKIHYKSTEGDSTYSCVGHSVFPPKGRSLVLYFAFYSNTINRDQSSEEFFKAAIESGLGVICVCNLMPKNVIADERIVYLETGNRWFTHLLIKNPQIFSAVSYKKDRESQVYAENFSTYSGFQFPIIHKVEDLSSIPSKFSEEPEERTGIVIQTEDGLGDILMSLPTAKTYASQGYDIYYLVEQDKKPIFENLDYITQVVSTKEQIPVNKIRYYFYLTHRLSDYSKEYNKQHRIHSTAHLCGLHKDQLVTNVPDIRLTEQEKKWATGILAGCPNPILVSWFSFGSSRTYNKVYQLCEKLLQVGYTPIVVGVTKVAIPEGAKDFTCTLNLRELFALTYGCKGVVTTDTGVLHVAGALHKPTVALFGPIPAEWRASTYKECVSLEPLDFECYPCADRQWHIPSDRMCENTGTPLCMSKHSPTQVVEALQTHLNAQDMHDNEIVKKDNSILFVSMYRKFGDCLFSIPTFRALRKKYPSKKIVWCTSYLYKDIVKHVPYIDGYVLFQGRIDDSWSDYVPNIEKQIKKYVQSFPKAQFLDLHISPHHTKRLRSQNKSIVSFVGRLANLELADTKLEYFPDPSIESKVVAKLDSLRKGYKGLITYNFLVTSIRHRTLFDEGTLEKALTLLEQEGYRCINVGHITEPKQLKRYNFHFQSLDYVYYAIKHSDLYIGYDSGIRNLAMTCSDNKVIGFENEHSLIDKTTVEQLSDSPNHVGISTTHSNYYDIYFMSKKLLEYPNVDIRTMANLRALQFKRK